MSDNLLAMRPAPDPSPLRLAVDAVDYCQCGRGPVIGIVSYTESRMWFFPIGTRNGDNPEGSCELSCIDCVAETVQRLASGDIAAERQSEARERADEINALGQRSQISVAPQSRQTSPSKGDQVT